MAEAHSAVAFSFSVSPEGVDVHVNHEALYAVWQSGLQSWKKGLSRLRNHFINGVYPASPASWLVTVSLVLASYVALMDTSFGLVDMFRELPLLRSLEGLPQTYLSCVLFATLLWTLGMLSLRYLLRALLTYHGWMYDERGKMTFKTKLWLGCVKLLEGRKKQLCSYQGSLPNLPVPSLKDTTKRYLKSVHPILNADKFKRMEALAEEFNNGIGKRLQRYLVLKSWWANNYVSDWWEDYVYLHGRSPIMVNSNYYGVDAIMKNPTQSQAARAANVIYSMLQFRKEVERQDIAPIMLNKTVPLCSWQYERQFNTTRIPGIDKDTLYHIRESNHIVVYHKGRYFKLYTHHKGLLLKPGQLENMIQNVLDDPSPPEAGEAHLAALTAGDRIPWAKARSAYFTKGVNKNSMDAIEKAAFFVALDEEAHDYDRNDPSKMDKYCRAMLHGKGYDRWFDKSFTLVICSNGRIGFNAEHSWADAPIMGHLWESSMADDGALGYYEDGHCKLTADFAPPNPIRLQWDLSVECRAVIESSLLIADDLIRDVDLHLLTHDAYGKGFMKTCKISPDAYIQMALQLAYFREAGRFCLTYEASMTRLFREGRTETVRSCTDESSAFARSMDDPSKTNSDRVKLLRQATDHHQEGYRQAMTGAGIDRHLFCLYIVSKYLAIESPFLKEVLSEPWRLSTSQTPHQQTEKLDLAKNPDMMSAGGGFGPVADDGYGVSYIVAGEDNIFFHISCKSFCKETDSKKFARNICKAMADMKELFAQKS